MKRPEEMSVSSGSHAYNSSLGFTQLETRGKEERLSGSMKWDLQLALSLETHHENSLRLQRAPPPNVHREGDRRHRARPRPLARYSNPRGEQCQIAGIIRRKRAFEEAVR